MKTGVKLRLANLTDLSEIQTLFVETVRATCDKDYNEEQIESWVSSVKNVDKWKGFIQNQYFLVAEIDGKIRGYGSLENGNYLDFMYVHKDYLRQGIANLLYENLKKESVRLGFDKMTSDVSITARPFFEAKDFKVLNQNRNLVNGVEIVNYHMTQ